MKSPIFPNLSRRLLLLNKLSILPRNAILLLDACIAVISFFISHLFLFGPDHLTDIIPESLWFGFIAAIIMWMMGSYHGVVRHTGYQDAKVLFKTMLLTILSMGFLRGIEVLLINGENSVLPEAPVSALASIFTLLLLILYRLAVKHLFSFVKKERVAKKKVLIFGAGEIGMLAYDLIHRSINSDREVVAFLDDDANMQGKTIKGLTIHVPREMELLVKRKEVKELVIAVNEIPKKRLKQITDSCLDLQVKVRVIPRVEEWINGELNREMIREIRIEDLLNRAPIQIFNPKLGPSLKGKVVLVTGAAGSIGSELSRQLVENRPDGIILLDKSESGLYDVYHELLLRKSPVKIISLLGDIRNKRKMKLVFSKFKPNLVFHAAAYKHVPMMETFPEEAISTNVLGTKILADLAFEWNVEGFLMVSTDKAVKPTNVMGASKRAAEMYVNALNALNSKYDYEKTKFIITRFGNVMGSNGSVIPLFAKQIKHGGPVNVTHKDIIRYFMTIPEACQLVLEASTMGKGGELFVFDMGDPVKIYDLAEKMIQLSGKKVGEDIAIKIIGLREGEKLYEELLNQDEQVLPTYHDKIKIAKTQDFPYLQTKEQIEYFKILLKNGTDIDLVRHLKSMVPEYKSNESRYVLLD
ncbi:MAG TPA: nucleoside-diphosphate sugar epimerase/dehydratase [Lunatimonas sp.]|nr:nucleoside-diphosphate sugar epimerase/dehydratase [Lunatimonas sp.]